MATTERDETRRVARPVTDEDHRLVHQFIRASGRRPTTAELDALRDHGAVVRGAQPRHAASAPGLAVALRREVARLVSRL